MPETLEGFAQRPRELRKDKKLPQIERGLRAAPLDTPIGRFERGTSHPMGGARKRRPAGWGVTGNRPLEGAAPAATKASQTRGAQP